ncbi:hypothetical protein AB0D59_40730 [Streptomyces sp. NPDC048417]|uniref:hypothetical protein n=1 Tax=Streptomyces sp. NPDC048417 TaxID=3155387 RepID=UPI003427559C
METRRLAGAGELLAGLPVCQSLRPGAGSRGTSCSRTVSGETRAGSTNSPAKSVQ